MKDHPWWFPLDDREPPNLVKPAVPFGEERPPQKKATAVDRWILEQVGINRFCRVADLCDLCVTYDKAANRIIARDMIHSLVTNRHLVAVYKDDSNGAIKFVRKP